MILLNTQNNLIQVHNLYYLKHLELDVFWQLEFKKFLDSIMHERYSVTCPVMGVQVYIILQFSELCRFLTLCIRSYVISQLETSV